MYLAYLINDEEKTILHDTRLGILLAEPIVTDELNTVNSFTFKIYNNHPQYENINPMGNSKIVVYDDNEIIFLGRVITVETDILQTKTVTCEGILGKLNDVIYTADYSSNCNAFFNSMIASFNTAKNDNLEISVANIETEFSQMYTNQNMFSILSDVSNNTGIYFYPTFNESDGAITTTLNIVSGFSSVCSQKVEFSKNVKSISIKQDGTSCYNRLLALGVSETTDDVTTQVDLTTIGSYSYKVNADGTITAYNDVSIGNYYHLQGSKYLIARESAESNGVIDSVYENTEITTASELLNTSLLLISNNCYITKTFEVTIIDLHLTNLSIEKIKTKQNVLINVKGLNSSALCTKKEIHLSDPSQDTITLGGTVKYLSKGA